MNPIAVIDEHIPSMTDENEQEVFDKAVDLCHGFDETGATAADLAIRTCRCGTAIDGFYEYVDHLKAELRKAGFS